MRTIHATADPVEFAEMLRSTRPRIAIIGTPPAGADEVAAALRERRRRPALRVVVVSPSDAIAERLEALRAGADEAHPDTIDPARARRATGAPRGTHASAARCRARRDRRHRARPGRARAPSRRPLIHLRPKEYGLLALLAAHPGRAYTRRELLERVWGPATWRSAHGRRPRPLAAQQDRARPRGPVHLVTVRGVGYRLDPPDALTVP